MNEHVRDDRLNDYVDDLLCREERAEVERHLLGCGRCRADVARLRDLVTDLGTMPTSAVPERDLLAAIHARIDAATAAGAAAPRTRLRAFAAAAAVLLVVGSAVAVGYVVGARERAAPGAPRVASATASPHARSVARADADYADAAAELERLLAQNRHALRPQTVRIIEDNLAVIDRALAEARAALTADPGNPMLEQLLMASHEKKLDLLRRAAQVGA
jgi:anti-sigma-K factor RskA